MKLKTKNFKVVKKLDLLDRCLLGIAVLCLASASIVYGVQYESMEVKVNKYFNNTKDLIQSSREELDRRISISSMLNNGMYNEIKAKIEDVQDDVSYCKNVIKTQKKEIELLKVKVELLETKINCK